MSVNELKRALEIIRNNDSADFEGEKTEELVLKAEHFLGVTFPPSYRLFLKSLGCGDVNGIEFYGLINDSFEHSTVPNAIWLTNDLRKRFNAPLSLVFVAESSEGFYAIDLNKTGLDSEAAVVDWNTEKAQGPFDIVADDFGCFVLDKLNRKQ